MHGGRLSGKEAKVYKARRHPARSLQPVWRFVKERHLIDLVSKGEMFFTHLPRLSDGLEGSLTARTRARLFRWLYAQCGDAAKANADVDDYEKHREGFYVNCWHLNDTESYLMWKVYADRGFAIETTIERLQGAFGSTSETVEGTVVNYLDYARGEFPIGNVHAAVETKDIPYRDEHEFRLLIWKPPQTIADVPTKNGIRVPVDVGAVLRKIYVSPQRAAARTAELSRLVRHKGLECEIVYSAVQEKARGGG
jgi:hypothetical protein